MHEWWCSQCHEELQDESLSRLRVQADKHLATGHGKHLTSVDGMPVAPSHSPTVTITATVVAPHHPHPFPKRKGWRKA